VMHSEVGEIREIRWSPDLFDLPVMHSGSSIQANSPSEVRHVPGEQRIADDNGRRRRDGQEGSEW
jgi:hypothetical protein